MSVADYIVVGVCAGGFLGLLVFVGWLLNREERRDEENQRRRNK